MTRQLDSHRPQAPPPRLAPPRRGRGRAVLDNVQSPFNVGSILRTAAALGRAPVARRRHRVAERHQGGARPRSARSASSTGPGTTPPRRGGGRRPGRPATGSSASSWPTTPCPLDQVTVDGPVCLVLGHEDRGLLARHARDLRRGGVHPPARAHRLAQRRHRRRHRPLRGAPALVGRNSWWGPRRARTYPRAGDRAHGTASSPTTSSPTPCGSCAPRSSPRPPPTSRWRSAGRSCIDRCHAAFDAEGRMAGVARGFAAPLTVPGGAELPSGAVSAVGVLPTHRRRGLLTALMDAQLADIADRGEPLATLIAAEYPIYGRFGYGPATEAVGLHIDAGTARWLEPPTGTVELVDRPRPSPRRSTPSTTVSGRDDPRPHRVRADRWRDRRRRQPCPTARTPGATPQGAVARRRRRGARPPPPTGSTSRGSDNRPAEPERRRAGGHHGRAEDEMLRFLASVDWVSERHGPPAAGRRPGPAGAGRRPHRPLRPPVRPPVGARVDVPAALGGRRYAYRGRSSSRSTTRWASHGPVPARRRARRRRVRAPRPTSPTSSSRPGRSRRLPGRAAVGPLPPPAGSTSAARARGRAAALFATVRAPWCAYTF